MTYDCINGWEDIISDMYEAGDLTRDDIDSEETDTVSARVIAKLRQHRTERNELRAALADLREWNSQQGTYEAPAWTRAIALLTKVQP
jgi:hypothetical protein